MARPLRIEYPGAIYHVTCRGNERKEIFRNNSDRKSFLEKLVISQEIYNVKTFSYVLMNNHFHIMLKTALGNLGEFMRHFNISYTSYFNRIHKRSGHLYQGRYKSMLIDSENYLSMVSRYIHLNPVRTMAMSEKSGQERLGYLMKYKWSSFPGFINKRWMEEFVNYEPVLLDYGGVNQSGRKEYKKQIYLDITDGLELKDKILEQYILGSERFVEWLKKNILKGRHDRECPTLGKLQKYRAREDIINAIEKETGSSISAIKEERGILRQIAMDLLYRFGGLKGREIGDMFDIDYSTVSVGRRRLRYKIQKDNDFKRLLSRIEANLSKIKN
ncbi:MAG: transposase [Candidatus Scalindua sp.]